MDSRRIAPPQYALPTGLLTVLFLLFLWSGWIAIILSRLAEDLFLTLLVLTIVGISIIQVQALRAQIERLKTALVRRTGKLVRLAKRYDIVVENLREGVIFIDTRTHVVLYQNPVILSYLKHASELDENFKPMTLLDCMTDDERLRVLNHLDSICDSPDDINRVLHAFTDHDRPLFLEIVCGHVEYEGHRAGMLLIRDVTDTRRCERERAAIIRMAAALRAAATRTEMGPILLTQLMDLLEAEGAMIAYHDIDANQLVMEMGAGKWSYMTGRAIDLSEAITAQVIQTGEVYTSDNIFRENRSVHPELIGELKAVLVAPLIAEGKVLGALWVGRRKPWHQDDGSILRAISDMAANAIRRSTLHEQTEHRLEQLQTLRVIDQAITGNLELSPMLEILLEKIINQLHVDAADIRLIDPKSGKMRFAAGSGFWGRAVEDLQLQYEADYSQYMTGNHDIIQFLSLYEGKTELEKVIKQTREGFTSYMALVLRAKGTVRGVLEVYQRESLSPDAEWLNFFRSMGGQAAIAIDNAMLFEGMGKANNELRLAYDATIAGWARALELRDKETQGHTQRVADWTVQLARELNMPDSELEHIRRGALLHDIGKMGIPDSILLKPGPLNVEEWITMRMHPIYAFNMLKPIEFLQTTLDIPHHHHEKWDGTGYPSGLKGTDIPLAARIFAVIDVWDALRTNRPYNQAWPTERVLDYIRMQSGLHFDPQVVSVFLRGVREGKYHAHNTLDLLS